MRVAIVTAPEDGGGGRAAVRLHEALGARPDVDPVLVTAAGERFGAARAGIDRLPIHPFPGRAATFSPAWLPSRAVARIAAVRPDVVNLHWAQAGFVRVEEVPRLRGRLVWTLHDMWAFTGGCHYSGGCTRYEHLCGRCPVLRSPVERDPSRWVHRRKLDAWRALEPVAISPSHWLAGCARRSALFADARVEVIPNGLDVARFRPVDRTAARRDLGLPQDAPVALFGAAGIERRKGGPELAAAVAPLRERGVVLATFGPVAHNGAVNLGTLADERLVAAYAAADVFVAPSLEDNLPNTVMEALACGTPVAAFDAGGMPDLVDDGVTGRLAPVGDVRALTEAIAWMLDDEARRAALGAAGRARAEAAWTPEQQAERYAAVFASLV